MGFSVVEADRYVQANIRRIEMEPVFNAADIVCMDGRNGVLNKVAYPGAAFGILGNVLAALYRELFREWEVHEDHQRLSIVQRAMPFSEMTAFFEDHLGGMSCHTDDQHHGQDHALACAGCGHAKLMLTNARYGLGEAYMQQLREYAVDLKRRSEAGDAKVTVATYSGHHKEQAIIRVKTSGGGKEIISVRPSSEAGSVFVINEAMAIKILKRVTGVFYENFKTPFLRLGVSRSELIAHVLSMYYRQVRLSAGALAKGLPVFDVRQSGNQTLVSHSNLRF